MTDTKPAEPTENQPGRGPAAPASSDELPEEPVAAEPTENQPGE